MVGAPVVLRLAPSRWGWRRSSPQCRRHAAPCSRADDVAGSTRAMPPELAVSSGIAVATWSSGMATIGPAPDHPLVALPAMAAGCRYLRGFSRADSISRNLPGRRRPWSARKRGGPPIDGPPRRPPNPATDAPNYFAAGERLNEGHALYALGRPTGRSSSTNGSPHLLSPPLIAVVWRLLATLPFELAGRPGPDRAHVLAGSCSFVWRAGAATSRRPYCSPARPRRVAPPGVPHAGPLLRPDMATE
jgi:hypothetical protein